MPAASAARAAWTSPRRAVSPASPIGASATGIFSFCPNQVVERSITDTSAQNTLAQRGYAPDRSHSGAGSPRHRTRHRYSRTENAAADGAPVRDNPGPLPLSSLPIPLYESPRRYMALYKDTIGSVRGIGMKPEGDTPTAQAALAALYRVARPAAAESSLRFFKQAAWARATISSAWRRRCSGRWNATFEPMALDEIDRLLDSAVLEARTLALMILGIQYKKSDAAKREAIFRLYLNRLDRVIIGRWSMAARLTSPGRISRIATGPCWTNWRLRPSCGGGGWRCWRPCISSGLANSSRHSICATD